MAIAERWEHTWRSGMIVSGTDDDAPEAEPALAFRTRLTLLLIVGVVAVAGLTAHVRLQVLRAEHRRVTQEIADVKTVTELLRCQVARRSAPDVIALYAEQEGLRPPASIAEIGPPTLTPEATNSRGTGVGQELRELSHHTAHSTAHRLGAILRGPAAGR